MATRVFQLSGPATQSLFLELLNMAAKAGQNRDALMLANFMAGQLRDGYKLHVAGSSTDSPVIQHLMQRSGAGRVFSAQPAVPNQSPVNGTNGNGHVAMQPVASIFGVPAQK